MRWGSLSYITVSVSVSVRKCCHIPIYIHINEVASSLILAHTDKQKSYKHTYLCNTIYTSIHHSPSLPFWDQTEYISVPPRRSLLFCTYLPTHQEESRSSGSIFHANSPIVETTNVYSQFWSVELSNCHLPRYNTTFYNHIKITDQSHPPLT